MTLIRISDMRAQAAHKQLVAENDAAEKALQDAALEHTAQLLEMGWESPCLCREGAFWRAEGIKDGVRQVTFAATPQVAFVRLVTP
jgi:hypothetical protein